MLRSKNIFLNIIFFLQVLLVFLLLAEDWLSIPLWLQVIGRLHPALLHLPIGLLILSVILVLAQNEFKSKSFRKILFLIVMICSVVASLSAILGFFLSRQSDYGPDALSQHKYGGLALSFFCYGLLWILDRYKKPGSLFYSALTLTMGVLFFTGHTGGTLTHGENYVLAPLKSSENEKDNGKELSAFHSVVNPILEKKCFSCHNSIKAKGKFIMTSLPEFIKGGKHGKEWMEGHPDSSRLIQYIRLPIEEEHHMPPEGKSQLTSEEISILSAWVKGGANVEKTLSEMNDSDTFKMFSMATLARNASLIPKLNYDFPAAPAAVVDALNTPSRFIFPLYQNSPALQADFFMGESYSRKSLEEMKTISEQVVIINLSKMPVTDEDLEVIGSFSNLEKLNLNFSKITGNGLKNLSGLKRLRSISLAGTAVSAESVKSLLDLPELTELFIWNTSIPEEERLTLSKAYPRTLISTTQFRDDKVLTLGKPRLMNEGVIKKDEMVMLKHSMPGVSIRYTLDGTGPDSVGGSLYTSPFKLDGTARIRAIACKPGWYCSEELELTCFIEGLKPDRTELLSETDSYYRGEGAKSLTDNEKGFIEVLNAPPWLGYKDRDFGAGFTFDKPARIRSIVISYAQNTGSSFFPPSSVQVFVGKSAKDAKLITTMQIPVPRKAVMKVEALLVPLTAGNYNYYKVVAKPLSKLPDWHTSKGKKGWLLIDEVFFNGSLQ